MSVTLDHFDVDPQTKPVLHVALERIRASLGLTDDLADGIIANQLIQFVKAGERNPDQLCAGALSETNTPVKGAPTRPVVTQGGPGR
jgi:hypothetical protein